MAAKGQRAYQATTHHETPYALAHGGILPVDSIMLQKKVLLERTITRKHARSLLQIFAHGVYSKSNVSYLHQRDPIYGLQEQRS